MIGYRAAFQEVRRDRRWKTKIFLGAMVSLIPYVGAVWLAGWQLDYLRNVAWGEGERIPEWEDFKRQALLGLKGIVAVLPYSAVLSVLITPPLMLFPLSSLLGQTLEEAALWFVGTAILAYSWMLAGMLLVIPFSFSTMLRVALYGTIESGFQFGEIWRVASSTRSDLMRAWRYSALNTLIAMLVPGLYFALVALAIAILPESWDPKWLVIIVLGGLGYLVWTFLSSILSMYLGLANLHHFGSYGRMAYRLAEIRPPAPSSDTVAVEGF